MYLFCILGVLLNQIGATRRYELSKGGPVMSRYMPAQIGEL